MHALSRLLIATSLFAVPGVAAAQAVDGTTSTREFAVIGNVPALCSGGTLTGGDGTYDLGVLTDTTTGLLRTDLAAPAKVLAGSFCSARSTINIAATPMTAQNFTAAPPAGFSRTVNYTATASGWTVAPATFDTGAAANADATQSRDTAFTGDINVGISGFSTGGGATLRPVADSSYLGTVTVTLTVAD